MNKLLYITLVVMLSSCSSEYVNVYHVNDKSEFEDGNGSYYALPKSVIKVDVAVTKKQYVKGAFAEYADKYLNISGAIKRNAVHYEISDVRLSSTAVSDANKYFYVELPAKCRKQPFSMQLNEMGIITGVNSVALPIQHNCSNTLRQVIESGSVEFQNHFFTGNLKVDVDTIYEKVMVDTTLITKRRYIKSLVPKSIDEKAKEAAEAIMQLRDDRSMLICGDMKTAYEAGTFRHMVDEMVKDEKEYLKLFTGEVFTTIENKTYYFTPKAPETSNAVKLFAFNSQKGFSLANASSSEAVVLNIAREHHTQVLDSCAIRQEAKATKRHGFYYSIPERATFSVNYKGEELIRKELLISQYGKVLSFPKSTINDVINYLPEQGSILDFRLY